MNPISSALAESADEFASVQISGVLGLNLLQILSVMPELPSLTNRSFVVDVADAVH